MGLFFKIFSFSTLLAIPMFFVCYITLFDQKPAPSTNYIVGKEYDYIVVGAGSAGSVVATRLAEEECASVLLLEAGGSPIHLDNVPFIGRLRWFTDIDWAFKTVPLEHTGDALQDRRLIWPSGKGLGGSSLINAMLYIRGAHQNFDDWENMGAKGWGWKDVFPYFQKLEDYRDPEYKDNGFHGTGGLMTVEKPRYDPKTKPAILKAVTDLGYKRTDINGEKMEGLYEPSATMRDGERCMTSKAYLVHAQDEKRKNLDIVNHAHVTKVLMEGTKAVGVEFGRYFWKETVKARKEVILSAGTTNTAQILMLSGIGPKEHLEELGIEVVADLPVGKFMQDHCSVPILYELSKDDEYTSLSQEFYNYAFNRSGFLASAEVVDYLLFINSKSVSPEVDRPDLQLYFGNFITYVATLQYGMTKEAYDQVYKPYEEKNTYFCYSSMVQPNSNGTVKLNSADPYDPPLIDPNYFADPEDLKTAVEGMKLCTKIVTSEPMQEFGARELSTLFPGCEDLVSDQDKYYTCVAKSLVVTMSHQVGTAKMGDPNDPTTVVDPELRVKGIEGLRVVDASVMPKVTSGNTNLPSIMIGEKGSDLIKKDFQCDQK